MAKKNKSKSKKPGTISKYLKSRGKEKYTYKKPEVKYDPYSSSPMQARTSGSRYDQIRQEQNKKRFEEAEKKMGKKYQIYDAIEDFSPGQIRNAQRRLGIKNATSKKEGARILRELINPTPMMAPPPPPITPAPPPPPPKEPEKDNIDKYFESRIGPLEEQLRQLGKSDPTANAIAALQQTIAGIQMPDYSADIEDLKTDQANLMKELAEKQAAEERRRELAFRTSQENIARGELTPDFRIGARSPRDRFGTSAFRRRPRYTSTIAQGIAPTTAGKTLNI